MNNKIPKIQTEYKASQSGDRESASVQGIELEFTIAEKKRAVDPQKLADDKFADSLQQECESASHSKCNLKSILSLSDEVRLPVLDFLAGLTKCEFVVKGRKYNTLFDAMLSQQVNPNNTEQMRRFKLAVLEVACFLCPDSLEIACNKIRDRMRKLKITGVTIKGLLAEAREMLSQLRSAGQTACVELISVIVAVPDAPVSDKLVVPAGWSMTDQNLVQTGGQSQPISAPVVIKRRVSAQNGSERLELSWKRKGRWYTHIVSRRDVADQRTILALAEYGLPVNSINARLFVQYLADFESANLESLPCVQASSHMGWQGTDGKDGFLWGLNLVTSDAIVLCGDAEQSSSPIQFRGLEEGENQLACGFRKTGSLKDWLQAIQPLDEHPRARFGLYAGFVPPMLQILRTNNFVIDFAGQTSEGKTTVLRVVASLWGNPIEGSSSSILLTWNGTPTWRERVAGVCRDLPLILDDTKNTRFPDEVSKTIYSVVQGRGRGRGTPQGIAQQGNCVTVLFSSGEQSAIGFTKDGGTRPRVLSFWGSPFGATSLDAGQLARQLTSGLQNHFGHAGPRFVQHLLSRRDSWGKWRNIYLNRVRHYEAQAGNDHVAGRMASHFAAIYLTSKLVHNALKIPWTWSDPVEPVWKELVSNSGDADVAAQALQHVYNWAVAHRENFYYRGKSPGDQPPGGWLGRWDRDDDRMPDPDGSEKWTWIGILQGPLNKVLAEGGFDEHATIRAWKERKWLKTNDKQRNTFRTKIGDGLPWVVAICRKAVEQ